MKRILALLVAILILFVSCNKLNDSSVETKNSDESEIIATASGDFTEATVPSGNEDPSEGANVNEPTTQGPTPLLYKVSDDDSVVWLMGTVHVGKAEFYPLPNYVYNAYESSDSLAIECDVAEFEKDMYSQYKVLKKFEYSDNTKISDHLSEETYTKAKALLTKYGFYASALDYYMPILWWQSIQSLMISETSVSARYGVDNHFYDRAKNDGKTIKEIESVKFQYEVLASFSVELQAYLLESLLASTPEAAEDEVIALVDLWVKGNEDALTEMYFSDEVSEEQELLEEYTQKFLIDRNITMTDYAEDALKTDEESFICVGVGHVVGDEGVAELLRDRGYTVEIVK